MQATQGHKKRKNKQGKKIAELGIDESISQRDIFLIIAVALLIIYIVAQCAISSCAVYVRFPETYTWSELMINYQGGFIRRALLGEILWQTKEICDLRITAIFLIYECFLVYYFILYKKLTNAYDKYLTFFLFASPVLMIFLPINSMNAFKKDVFVLVALLLQFHCISQYIQHQISAYKTYAYTFILFVIGTLIHEILIFYTLLPALLLWQEEYKRGRGVLSFISIGAVIALVTLLIWLHFGTNEQVAMISQSWESFLGKPEGSLNYKAVAWLDKGLSEAWKNFARVDNPLLNVFITFIAFLLAAIPLLIVYHSYGAKKSIQEYFTIPYRSSFLGIALIFPFSLFVIIIDHGRVISFTMMYYLFFLVTMQEVCPQRESVKYANVINRLLRSNKLRAIVLFCVLLYACTWRVIPVNPVKILQFSMPMRELLRALGLWS